MKRAAPSQNKTPLLSFETLKTKQRKIREKFPSDHGLRVHRGLSWLNRAESAGKDHDAAFIFYWIAFNALYADDKGEITNVGVRSAFDDYFTKVVPLDVNQRIYDAIWTKFSGSIRLILDNRYVFQPFWSFQNKVPGNDNWEERFEKNKKRTQIALKSKDTKTILKALFDRLYVLRNQLIHGGSTWNSSVNRSQVKDGASILAFLVPLFIDIMMDNPQESWGAPYYPIADPK
jgi:hypothetical protein